MNDHIDRQNPEKNEKRKALLSFQILDKKMEQLSGIKLKISLI